MKIDSLYTEKTMKACRTVLLSSLMYVRVPELTVQLNLRGARQCRLKDNALIYNTV